MEIVDLILKFIGALFVGLAISLWLKVDMYAGNNVLQIIIFAIGVTLLLTKLRNK